MINTPASMLAIAFIAALVVAIVMLNRWYSANRSHVVETTSGLDAEQNGLDLNTW